MKLSKPVLWTTCVVIVGATVFVTPSRLQAQQQKPAGTRSANQASPQPQPGDPNICLDEGGLRNSIGLMRKINGQIQACVVGSRWVAAPGGQVATPATEVGKRDCKGSRDQAYESGLFRAIGEKADKFERCADGKWVPVTGGGLTIN
jgi:hypothetical protein